MADKQKLYLGRPINLFNTREDGDLLKAVAEFFSDCQIEDPSQKKHGEGYAKYKSLKGQEYNGRIVNSGMDYYFQEVLPDVDAGIFVLFRDGMFGKGVFGEAEFLEQSGKSIYEVDFDWKKYISSSVGRPLNLVRFISLNLDSSRCLSVEETMKRVYVDGDFKKGIKSFFED